MNTKVQNIVKLDQLRPWDRNPRSLDKKDFLRLKKQITKFGIYKPLIVCKNHEGYEVIGGNMRLAAIKELGHNEAWVSVVEPKTEAEKIEIALSDNDRAGYYDEDKLAELAYEFKDVIEMEDYHVDLGKTISLDELVSNYAPSNEKDDEVPEVRKTDIKLGDMFTLGEHRLMCGDSTDRGNVERLMGEERADMVFTSPPYNLGVSANLRGNTVIGKRGNVYEEYDDAQSESLYLDLLLKFMEVWIEKSNYICINLQSLAGNRKSLWEFLHRYSQYFCDVAIWNKQFSAPAVAQNVMNSSFEFLFFFCKDNPTRAIRTANFRGDVSNVLDIPPQRKNEYADVHGATFPVELPTQIIKTFTQPQMLVVDPFSGTGSTLIACEKLNRKCRMMEIDPVYCQVIIERWEEFIGKKAEKINGD